MSETKSQTSISRRRIIPALLGMLSAPATLLAATMARKTAPKRHVITWSARDDGHPLWVQDIFEGSEPEWAELKLRDPKHTSWATHRLESSTAGSEKRLVAISPQRFAKEIQARVDASRRERTQRFAER